MDSSQIVGRGPQVGLVVASATVPGTFTRSLSERTWVDQGIITGLSTVTQYVVSVVAQDGIDIGGSLLARMLPFPDTWSDEQRRRAATLLLDITVVPIGFGLAGLFRFRDNDDQMRALVRQVGLRLGVTGQPVTLSDARSGRGGAGSPAGPSYCARCYGTRRRTIVAPQLNLRIAWLVRGCLPGSAY